VVGKKGVDNCFDRLLPFKGKGEALIPQYRSLSRTIVSQYVITMVIRIFDEHKVEFFNRRIEPAS